MCTGQGCVLLSYHKAAGEGLEEKETKQLVAAQIFD